jgi:hypothetical protein
VTDNAKIIELDPDSPEMRQLYVIVGRLVSECNGLEHALEMLHETLVQTPLYELMRGEGFETARQGCLQAARHRGGEVESTVRAVVTEAKRVWDLRGQVVHGSWLPAQLDDGPDGIMRLYLRRRSGSTSRDWTFEELEGLIADARASWEEVEELYLDLQGAP